jgi:hypothetical protein
MMDDFIPYFWTKKDRTVNRQITFEELFFMQIKQTSGRAPAVYLLHKNKQPVGKLLRSSRLFV